MNLKLSCPSKTFLLGEYLVLKKGQGLLVNTTPRFQLEVKSRGRGTLNGVPPMSPAGLFFQQNQKDFSRFSLVFSDPHAGQGGFGASGAQYLLMHVARSFVKGELVALGENSEFIEKVWQTYTDQVSGGSGCSPSGADILSQWAGALCEVSLKPFGLRGGHWPFKNLGFSLFRTGFKVSTHEHLAQLNQFDSQVLAEIFEDSLHSLSHFDEQGFVESLAAYGRALHKQGLQCEESFQLVSAVQAEGFRGVKACGALGADALVVLHPKSDREALLKVTEKLQLENVATEMDLSSGVEVKVLPNLVVTKGALV